MKCKASFIAVKLRLQNIGFACLLKSEGLGLFGFGGFFPSPLTSDLTHLNAFGKGCYKKNQEYFSLYSLRNRSHVQSIISTSYSSNSRQKYKN